MNEAHTRAYAKINQVSKIVLLVLILLILMTVIMLFLLLVGLATTPTSTGEHFFHAGDQIAVQSEQLIAGLLTLRDKILLLLVVAAFSLLFIPGLVFGCKMMINFRDGQVFSHKNVLYARYIALLYLVFVLCDLGMNLYLALVPETMDITIDFLTVSGKYIVLGLLWLIVWVLEIGAALQLDSDMTI